jgi:hypothetical protein
MKLCVNCKHFAMEKHSINPELGKCTANRTTSLVTGLLATLDTLPFCAIQRCSNKPCGHDGVLFEDKEASNV